MKELGPMEEESYILSSKQKSDISKELQSSGMRNNISKEESQMSNKLSIR